MTWSLEGVLLERCEKGDSNCLGEKAAVKPEKRRWDRDHESGVHNKLERVRDRLEQTGAEPQGEVTIRRGAVTTGCAPLLNMNWNPSSPLLSANMCEIQWQGVSLVPLKSQSARE